MKIQNIINTLLMLSVSNVFLLAQDVEAVAAPGPSIWEWVFNNLLLIVGGIIIVAVFYSLLKLSFSLLSLQKANLMKDLGMEKEAIVQELRQPTWKRLYDWAWSVVPVANEQDIDLGHDYDGIRELDNRLPPWWLALMYGSMAFAAVYMYVYHWSGSDWSSEKEYIMAVEHGEEMKKAYLAKQADFVDETNVSFVTDDASLAVGKDIYFAQCAVCHGQLGEGLVGPNFTDPYWINGGDIVDLFKTIKYGVPEKGMISWKSQLRPSDMQNVASYILTLQGTNPPNQKAQEGEFWDNSANEAGETPDETTGALEVEDSKM